MSRKAQGLPINIIIIAIISLIVLGVILFVFRGQIANVARSFIGITKEAACPKELPADTLGIFGRCKQGQEQICRHPGCLYSCNPDGSMTLIQECEKGCNPEKTDCK